MDDFPSTTGLADGSATGRTAAVAAGFERASDDEAAVPSATTTAKGSTGLGAIVPLWFVPAAPGQSTDRHFIDLQRDATVANIELAISAGLRYPEHIKRFTTIGTGNDQGRTSAVNEVGIVAELLGQPMEQLAPTAFRPPITPIPYGVMAGRERGDLFDPI